MNNSTKFLLQAIDKRAPEMYEPSPSRTYPMTVEDKIVFFNPARLAKGNSKLDKILIFDLPAGSTTKGALA
jgi:hypothetical protein